MVALVHCRLHCSLFSPNSLSFHLPPAVVEFVPVNAATRLLTSKRGRESNRGEKAKLKESTFWYSLLVFGFRLHNRCRSKKPLFYQGLRTRSKMSFFRFDFPLSQFEPPTNSTPEFKHNFGTHYYCIIIPALCSSISSMSSKPRSSCLMNSKSSTISIWKESKCSALQFKLTPFS